LIAGGVGILLGAVISRTLAAPLDQLAIQARAFATRDWSRRVAIRNQLNISEVAAVAHAFNHMADSLQQAETVRRHLVADIAHELRTPLTVLQGNLRALLDGVYPLEMSEIASLYDETTLLARLVDDLRQLALAEAGQLPLTCQPLTVIDLLQTTAERYTVAAEAKAITLTVTLPPTLPPVYADSDRVAQVLHNLISNALRHTPSGGKVVLAAAIQPGAVKISIQDNGEGIDPAALPHVFDRFYRPTAQGEQHNDGSGLGLTIAKTLVEAMGGAIGVESQAGLGACFWFTLPQAQAFDSHCSPSAMQ
jgi:two-component system OmpR family sensor kinase/two-component system sensor histidine kinase BaeS